MPSFPDDAPLDADAADLGGGEDIDDVEDDPDNSGEEEGGIERGQHAEVKCTTTAGPITMRFHRAWSPNGYDRASSLFEKGYYDNSHFFRVVPHFLVQFGITYSTDGELKKFADTQIKDDTKREDLMPFREGYLSFAGSGPNSRTSQLFIAYDRASGLGNSPWETPFGEVVDGMDNVRNLYSVYGDMPPWGKGPQQGPIRNQGSKYIEENFPLLDKFQTCTVRRMDSLPNENEKKGTAALEEEEDPHDATRKKMVEESYNAMRGGGARGGEARREMKEDDEVAENQFPIWGKLAIAVVVLVFLSQLVARRKKSKRAGKHV